MIPTNEALGAILENTEILPSEERNLLDALGMVTAEDIKIDINVPPFNRAAMDGYAVIASDTKNVPAILNIIEEIPAGSYAKEKVTSGRCSRIMTGAPVPDYADAVVMKEQTEQIEENRVKIKQTVKPLENICPEGEDARAGQVIIEKGTQIGAAEIGIICFAGKNNIRVYKKPEVFVIPTGNEIIEHWKKPEGGQIRNTNGPMLLSLLKQIGIKGKYSGVVGDNEEELLNILVKALEENDVVLLSGGVSMGEYDLVPEIVKKAGVKVIFHKVRIKPGKPLLFGRKGNKLVFGIPGNPVSNFTSFHMFIKPALRKMMGYNSTTNFIIGYITRDWQKKTDRAQIIPAVYQIKNGKFYINPLDIHGSGDLINCRGVNCLGYIEAGSPPLKKGDEIQFLIL